MNRKRIKDIRNEELITATMAMVHRHGYSSVTVKQIAVEANASTGSIHYYFANKEALLAATMLHLLNILHKVTLERLAKAITPRERLEAIVASNFDKRLFVLEQCNVWVQFWANAPYEKPLARLHNINRCRVKSNLLTELRKILPPEKSEIAREALQAYMDGVWIEASQSLEPLDPLKAEQQVMEVIDMLLDFISLK